MTSKFPVNLKDIPCWARWLAQDANGSWWAYEAEPHAHHQGWYENEVGRSVKLIIEKQNPNWHETLQRLKTDA